MHFRPRRIIIAAILVVVLPRVLSSKLFSFQNQTKPSLAPTASTPLPAPGTSAKDGWIKHPSGLGGNGGLGIASLSESEAGRIKVYTPNTLPEATMAVFEDQGRLARSIDVNVAEAADTMRRLGGRRRHRRRRPCA